MSEADALLSSRVENEGCHILASFAHVQPNHDGQSEGGDHDPDGSAHTAAAGLLLVLKGHGAGLVAGPGVIVADHGVASSAFGAGNGVAVVADAGSTEAVAGQEFTASVGVVVDIAISAVVALVGVDGGAHGRRNQGEVAAVAADGAGLAHPDGLVVEDAVFDGIGVAGDVEEGPSLARRA